MDDRHNVVIEDLAEGAELTEEELRAIVGAQRSCFEFEATVCTCAADGGYDCD